MRRTLIHSLLVIAALSICAAFALPITKYSVASKEKIDELFGGKEGAQEIYSDIVEGFSGQIQVDSDSIVEGLIDSLNERGLCRLGVCKVLEQSGGQLTAVLAREIEPVIADLGSKNIDKFYDSVTNYLYDQFQKSKYAEAKESNIIQVVEVLFATNQVVLAVIILVFSVIFPLAKLIFSAANLLPNRGIIIENIYAIASKLSLLEVFILAVLIVSFQSLPFLSLEVGYIALGGYVVFTFSLVAVDLIRHWKSSDAPTVSDA